MWRGCVLAVLLGGCGDRFVADLDATELEQVCMALEDQGTRIVKCPDAGTEFGVRLGLLETDCIRRWGEAGAACEATVEDLRTCNRASLALSDEEACAGTQSPECDVAYSEDCIP